MPILEADIQTLASRVMDDVPNGGGGPSGTVIPYGQSNGVFSDATEADRAGGNVSVRQLHAAVRTLTVDSFMGGQIILSQPPSDANVSVTLAKCDLFARRTAIASAIANYLIQGPQWAGFLLENHVAGQRKIQIFHRPNTPTPSIGRTLVLTYLEGQVGERIQYVRVTRVTTEVRTFTYASGGAFVDYLGAVTELDLSDALRFNFPGSPPDRGFAVAANRTVLRDTTVADAATYYGAQPLTVPAALGSRVLKVASVYSQLVPSSRTETVALDQRPAAQRVLTLATSPREVNVGAAPHSTRIKVGQENRGFSWVNILKPFPAPNTLVISYMAMGVWYTVTDDGAGALAGAGAGTVNYANGTIALTVPALPDVDSAIIFNWGEKSAFTNRTGQAGFRAPEYALKLDHAGIKPGTLVVQWMSGGSLRSATDNGTGELAGGYATGEINYASGDLFIRPLHMPDAGAQFAIGYDWATLVTKSVAVSPDAGGYANIALDTVPAAGSVTVRWITVRDVSISSGASAGGSASNKTTGSNSTTVFEPNPDYTAPSQPSAPQGVPTGVPVAITRVPISGMSYVTSYMAAGGTRAGTGGTVYIGVSAENGANGLPSSYPVPDASGVVWSEQEYQDGKKVIGGITYPRWVGPLTVNYGLAAAG